VPTGTRLFPVCHGAVAHVNREETQEEQRRHQNHDDDRHARVELGASRQVVSDGVVVHHGLRRARYGRTHRGHESPTQNSYHSCCKTTRTTHTREKGETHTRQKEKKTTQNANHWNQMHKFCARRLWGNSVRVSEAMVRRMCLRSFEMYITIIMSMRAALLSPPFACFALFRGAALLRGPNPAFPRVGRCGMSPRPRSSVFFLPIFVM